MCPSQAELAPLSPKAQRRSRSLLRRTAYPVRRSGVRRAAAVRGERPRRERQERRRRSKAGPRANVTSTVVSASRILMGHQAILRPSLRAGSVMTSTNAPMRTSPPMARRVATDMEGLRSLIVGQATRARLAAGVDQRESRRWHPHQTTLQRRGLFSTVAVALEWASRRCPCRPDESSWRHVDAQEKSGSATGLATPSR